MHQNEEFLTALKYMDDTMRQDLAAGHQWKYCNKTGKKAKNFAQARAQGKYLINCVDGVQWALDLAGVDALSWYGGKKKIVWLTKTAEANARRYFDIIETGGKKVKDLYDNMRLCDGDILLGFASMTHTCAYFGGSKSFDSGHAYCDGNGEGAKFKKWIGALSCKNSKVYYIMRLKDRAHYRVQAGAYNSLAEYEKQAALVEQAGFGRPERKFEDGMYKVQVALCDGKTNAERIAAQVAAKEISVFVKEL